MSCRDYRVCLAFSREMQNIIKYSNFSVKCFCVECRSFDLDKLRAWNRTQYWVQWLDCCRCCWTIGGWESRNYTHFISYLRASTWHGSNFEIQLLAWSMSCVSNWKSEYYRLNMNTKRKSNQVSALCPWFLRAQAFNFNLTITVRMTDNRQYESSWSFARINDYWSFPFRLNIKMSEEFG